jgi:Domain of Unknown Function (DUF1080)
MWLLLFQSLLVMAQTASISDSFTGYKSGRWPEGGAKGPWVLAYHGYGQVGVQVGARNNKVLAQRPGVARSLNETHASLVLSQKAFTSPTIAYRSKVVEQLRQPVPNAWETAWVVWNYVNDHQFYYFALKTNGWELGKVDNKKLDPKGPECLWPQYINCRYLGAQRFLSTGASPKAQIGRWQRVRVEQMGNSMAVYVGDQLVVRYLDSENPYLAGQIGLYNEDAHVQFDDVSVVSSP